ncbi:hypothetical protein DVK85_07590 [Flavobacterium arcticum]|uniref:Uncharacterized protein n=1 Tax=Flavobacterium arcticum TaxID=1784713 RepID=A0A345HC00_9FLAO|nr:hypothetical protein [Flavobacterium arcticum]AXG74110.1 hypothetical protein DVK85_07590 [Flavobacterium arcticum]KAF2507330.1 hypothetical protein E0W72_12305 [Flavobacterium arcticum]
MKTIKKYYEVFALMITLLSFFLFRQEVFSVNTYLIIGGIVALYFVPVKMIAAIVSLETKQTGLKVTSSIIITAIIAASLIAVNNKHFSGISTIVYTLAGINIIFMIYAFLKDQERKLFLLHMVMILLTSRLVAFL